MKIVEQQFKIIEMPPAPLQLIEAAGRTCYKSEDRITQDSAERMVKMLICKGHHSVLEHVSATARIIANRGVSHELITHRLISKSQESTRYCNYGGKEIEFIRPVWCSEEILGSWYAGFEMYKLTDDAERRFLWSCLMSETDYKELLELGWRPEQAREVLNHALKTEIVLTANIREWRHIFNLRTSKQAHPQMRALMAQGLKEFYNWVPALFEDLLNKEETNERD